MEHMRSGDDVFIRLDPGDEIHASVQAVCANEGISGAALTSGIGRVRDIDIGYLGASGIYQRVVHEGPMELLSTQGNVGDLDGQPFTHIHIVLSDDDHAPHGGHLFSATVAVVAELHLRVMERGPAMMRCGIEGSEFVALTFEE